MKTVLPLFMSLLLPVMLAAQDEKLDQLLTVDGKAYKAVTIRKVEPDGLSILHEAGTAKVPFENLSADLQKKYGYDKDAAAEHRKKLAKVQRLQDASEREASAKRKLTAEAIRSTLGRTVDQKTFWGYRDAAKGGVIAATETAEVVIARRESSTSIFWEGKAWRIGRIKYKNTRGFQVTMLRYTASEKEAAAFYKKNGFSPKSDEITRTQP